MVDTSSVRNIYSISIKDAIIGTLYDISGYNCIGEGKVAIGMSAI